MLFMDLLQDGNRCGILVEEVTRAQDVGEYACTLGVVSDEVDYARGIVTVDVVVPADVHFDEDMSGADVLPVTEGESFIVKCHALGGYPLPEIMASLGDEEGPVDLDLDIALEEVESGHTMTENEDGTADVTKAYYFVPHRSDCGKYLKCAASQADPETGEIVLAPEDSLMTQKIMVQFGPTPLLDQEQSSVIFTPGDEVSVITLTFEANPVPEDNQAIWHIAPRDFAEDSAEEEYASADMGGEYSGDYNSSAIYDDEDDSEGDYYESEPAEEEEEDMHDVVVVQAGEVDGSGRYEADSLNISDHTVTAVLTIRNLVLEDMDNDYSLVVVTDVGEMTYNVQLVSHYDNSATESPNDDRESDSSADESASTASTGTIVAIVLVILLVFFALGFVFWAKRYNKCCFHQHQVVVVKKDSGGAGRGAEEDVEVATRLTDQMDNGNKMPSSGGAPPPGEDEKPESDKKLDSGNE